jgi:hypothetical protein
MPSRSEDDRVRQQQYVAAENARLREQWERERPAREAAERELRARCEQEPTPWADGSTPEEIAGAIVRKTPGYDEYDMTWTEVMIARALRAAAAPSKALR